MKLTKNKSLIKSIVKIFLIFLTLFLVGSWLFYTPPGLLGKADAIGYAVCHQIPERCFSIGDRPTSLCARCSGMYLGALIGFLYQLRKGKRGGMPSIKASIVLAIFLLAFAFDGLNSYVHLNPLMDRFPQIPRLYEPQNYLRLFTGTGLGLGMAAMLLPVFHQTAWVKWDTEPALKTWRHLAEILIICAIVAIMVLSENPIILYPLSILSSATVLAILSMVYTIVWIMIGKRENQFNNWRELSYFLLAGFNTAMIQIIIMDYGRYQLTGSWQGFQL